MASVFVVVVAIQSMTVTVMDVVQVVAVLNRLVPAALAVGVLGHGVLGNSVLGGFGLVISHGILLSSGGANSALLL